MFDSPAWFALLQAHGLAQPPRRCWNWPLAPATGAAQALYLPLMQQQPGGPWLALSNYYSGLYGPVGASERLAALTEAQWQAAIAALRRQPAGHGLRLQPLAADSAWLALLQAQLRRAGYWTDRFFCFGNWFQPVPAGGFADYWAQRPSALRHSVERGQRRLARAGPWHIAIVQAPGPALEEALAAYLAVYAQSWKAPEACPAFMPALVRWAAHQGALRLGLLWRGMQPVAAQVWWCQDGKALIYKLAYVQGQERFSVGSVLTAALMRHAMEVDGVAEVDYLSGDDAYKRDWMAQRRARVGLLAFDPRRPRGLLAAGRHFAGGWWRGRQRDPDQS